LVSRETVIKKQLKYKEFMKDLTELLKSGSSRIGVYLDPSHIRLFGLYLEELKEWNAKFNLTAITTDEEIVIKHFIDSLACLLVIPPNSSLGSAKLIDIGSGAGFPGVPLKIYRPDLQVTLLEASQKKSGFLRHLGQQLNLAGLEVLTGRAEDYGQKNDQRENYDLVVVRAVDTLSVLAEYALPFLKPGGIFVAQKGPQINEELAQAQAAIKALGGMAKGVKSYELSLGKETLGRTLVTVEKISPTPAQYPRRSGVPKKKPIK
jgi:16S rRNA (guanine527-N7)-methyltransferase